MNRIWTDSVPLRPGYYRWRETMADPPEVVEVWTGLSGVDYLERFLERYGGTRKRREVRNRNCCSVNPFGFFGPRVRMPK